MTVTDIINDARVAHVRELKTEVSRLKAELSAAHAANEEWERHFALALAAARDVDRLPSTGRIILIDGWNVVFNSRFKPDRADAQSRRQSRAQVVDFVREYALANPADFIWLVFDGKDDNSEESANLRVSYTGGEGAHRADRLIVDYVRLMRLTGRVARVTAITNDKDFIAELTRLGAQVENTREFIDAH